MDEATEATMIRRATEILEASVGTRPLGWMGPWIAETNVTPDLLKEAGYTFLMDWPADDQPFWMRTRSGPILSVPYPIEVNDSPTMLSRAQSATDFHRMIVDQFEEMIRQSQRQSLVFGVSLHTFVAGQPFRLNQIRQALRAIMQHPAFDQVWVTTPGRIAEHISGLSADLVPR
jgi:allantoinase